ncbi:hypothetical protein CLF_112219 [Clonorchis sinensis]|uniref:Uncharacterized protein n=1 Tax=Clonorchis sinensis TaxID=79923 RepID=G7YW02_CLOSI|nr:hypothetical protein CLF_112219 [Clonorchis sinensis]
MDHELLKQSDISSYGKHKTTEDAFPAHIRKPYDARLLAVLDDSNIVDQFGGHADVGPTYRVNRLMGSPSSTTSALSEEDQVCCSTRSKIIYQQSFLEQLDGKLSELKILLEQKINTSKVDLTMQEPEVKEAVFGGSSIDNSPRVSLAEFFGLRGFVSVAKKVAGVTVEPDAILVSFDVNSLESDSHHSRVGTVSWIVRSLIRIICNCESDTVQHLVFFHSSDEDLNVVEIHTMRWFVFLIVIALVICGANSQTSVTPSDDGSAFIRELRQKVLAMHPNFQPFITGKSDLEQFRVVVAAAKVALVESIKVITEHKTGLILAFPFVWIHSRISGDPSEFTLKTIMDAFIDRGAQECIVRTCLLRVADKLEGNLLGQTVEQKLDEVVLGPFYQACCTGGNDQGYSQSGLIFLREKFGMWIRSTRLYVRLAGDTERYGC